MSVSGAHLNLSRYKVKNLCMSVKVTDTEVPELAVAKCKCKTVKFVEFTLFGNADQDASRFKAIWCQVVFF